MRRWWWSAGKDAKGQGGSKNARKSRRKGSLEGVADVLNEKKGIV